MRDSSAERLPVLLPEWRSDLPWVALRLSPSAAWLTAFLIAMLLGGCGGSDMDELQSYVDKVKQRPPAPLEPLPEIPQIDTYVYEPGSRRDPFAMDDRTARAAMPRPSDGIAPDPLRRKEELEQFSLDSLRMVGTLEQHETRWGLVVAPDGILHRVRVGNYLGQNNGQITRISPEGIQ
ncbi:MAG: pilus assembly protein PilP, partial [Planctomycetes bacterium]|nr:pilus assembly protein PilP [Planctomycetota bacterium]